MKTPPVQLRSPPKRALGIAVVLAIVAALSVLVGPTFREAPRSSASRGLLAASAEPGPTLSQEARPGIRARARCAECGVIVSSSETETLSELMDGRTASTPALVSSRRWITVRLADGSSRVINDATPADWRLRERVIVIGGLAAVR
ncbi:MAG TPA: hypothetical protein VNT02_13355 [Burkholderiales bacterium]|nr:hypothetical protein [Burkholderiales bacterium]